MDDVGVIHVHAQKEWHDDAYIVANRTGLEKLRALIDIALEKGTSSSTMMPQDGECFDLHVILDDSDWQSDTWKRRALPYTDEVASQCQPANTLFPWADPTIQSTR